MKLDTITAGAGEAPPSAWQAPDAELVQGFDASGRYWIRKHARAMALQGRAETPEARQLVETVWTAFSLPQIETSQRPTSIPKLRHAVSAILGDLLIAARSRRWAKRSLNDHSFTRQPVSRTNFKTAWNAMQRAGLIVSFSGFQVRGGGRQAAWGGQTCFSGTPLLLDLAATHGIDLDDALRHFDAGRVPVPPSREQLKVHARVVKLPDGSRRPSRTLPIAEGDKRAQRIRADVAELNGWLGEQDIKGFAFAGLRRIFNDGDQPDFAWQWGGRFYSLPGGDDYINWKGGKEARAAGIELQGEKVAEVDISAAHLTILYTLRGVPFDHTRDPYAVPGVPRDRVKRWLMFALGRASVAERGVWYARVREEVLKRHPVLLGLDGYGIGTLDLQFHEAEVMLRTMKLLRDRHGIVSLPVHDSLVVPVSKVDQVRDVLAEAFMAYFRDEMGMTNVNHPRVS